MKAIEIDWLQQELCTMQFNSHNSVSSLGNQDSMDFRCTLYSIYIYIYIRINTVHGTWKVFYVYRLGFFQTRTVALIMLIALEQLDGNG